MTPNRHCCEICSYIQIIRTFCEISATSGKILLDAKKNGDNYYWTNGNKAYFQVAAVTNAGDGDCAYIDITTSTLHGLNCATTANIICQKSRKFFCLFILRCKKNKGVNIPY